MSKQGIVIRTLGVASVIWNLALLVLPPHSAASSAFTVAAIAFVAGVFYNLHGPRWFLPWDDSHLDRALDATQDVARLWFDMYTTQSDDMLTLIVEGLAINAHGDTMDEAVGGLNEAADEFFNLRDREVDDLLSITTRQFEYVRTNEVDRPYDAETVGLFVCEFRFIAGGILISAWAVPLHQR